MKFIPKKPKGKKYSTPLGFLQFTLPAADCTGGYSY